MSVEEHIKNRIIELITEAPSLSTTNDSSQALNEQQKNKGIAWMASAHNALNLICTNLDNSYRDTGQKISDRYVGWDIPNAVGEFSQLLENLLKDIDAGLLVSVANKARAETFDDFLDHAKYYLKDNKKKEAGVIAGVVFEDSLRSVCSKYKINEKDNKLDQLISALTNKGLLTKTKAKRARVSAHVRTKATHAQWDEFDLSDVKETIDFTYELISSHLEN